MFGLPDGIAACLFDMDGVVTQTAVVHAAAWKEMFDGFPVHGLGVPGLAIWKGDRVTASVAAASVLAKVSRDRMMRDLHERYPLYGFDRHKGYVTDEHVSALAEHGPSPVHRYSFVNVTRAAAMVNPVDLMAPVDPAELLEPAELLGPAGQAAALVASGIGPAGISGENERRVDP